MEDFGICFVRCAIHQNDIITHLFRKDDGSFLLKDPRVLELRPHDEQRTSYQVIFHPIYGPLAHHSCYDVDDIVFNGPLFHFRADDEITDRFKEATSPIIQPPSGSGLIVKS